MEDVQNQVNSKLYHFAFIYITSVIDTHYIITLYAYFVQLYKLANHILFNIISQYTSIFITSKMIKMRYITDINVNSPIRTGNKIF